MRGRPPYLHQTCFQLSLLHTHHPLQHRNSRDTNHSYKQKHRPPIYLILHIPSTCLNKQEVRFPFHIPSPFPPHPHHVTSSLTNTQPTDAFSGVTDTVGKTAGGVANTAGGAVSGLGDTVSGATKGVTDTAGGAAKGTGDTVKGATGSGDTSGKQSAQNPLGLSS